MKRMIKIAVALVFIVATVLPIASCASNDKVIHVYNWGDYIDDSVIEAFEKETGYTVKYDTYDTNETMYTKLTKGNTSYDLLVPSDYMIDKLIKEDRLEKLDFSNIPNYSNINPEFKNLAYDKNNEYSVPYMWGTLGILYNKTMVDEPVDSWEMLWNEKYKDNIIMYDSSRDSIGIALKMLGYSMNTLDDKELEEAKAKLMEQTHLVSAYVVDEVKDMMIQGSGALALAWAGDAEYCHKENADLEYVIPKEGSNIFYDSLCIPKGCKNKAGAEALINYLCKPEVSKLNAEYIGYSTPIDAARKLMGEDGESYIAYPDVKLYNLECFVDVGDKTKTYDKLWTEVTASVEN